MKGKNMKCRNIDNTSFGARLTTDRYAQAGKKLRKYLGNGIIEFEKQTKNKEGCMTLRQLDDLDDSPEAVFFFWNSKTAPRHYDICLIKVLKLHIQQEIF